MEYFFSYENSTNKIDYFFNKNHFVILFIALVIAIFFCMYITRQRLKHQKIAVFVVGLLLVILEGLRIFWQIKYLQHNEQELTFLSVSNIDFFVLSFWISLPIILISSFAKKRIGQKIFGLDFVFSICCLFAIITLIYPININTNFEFYHVYNLCYVLIRSLVIMISFMFVCARWIKVYDFLDLYKALLSLMFMGGFCLGVNYLLNNPANLFYINYFPVFEALGIYLSFPFNVICLGLFVFVLQIFLYLPFRIYKAISIRRGNNYF